MTVMGATPSATPFGSGVGQRGPQPIAELAATDLAPQDRYLVDCLITLFDGLRGRPFDASLEKPRHSPNRDDRSGRTDQLDKAWLALVVGHSAKVRRVHGGPPRNPPNASEELPVAARAACGRQGRRRERRRPICLARSGCTGARSTPACGRSSRTGRMTDSRPSPRPPTGCDSTVARNRRRLRSRAVRARLRQVRGARDPDAKAAAEEAEGIFRRSGPRPSCSG